VLLGLLYYITVVIDIIHEVGSQSLQGDLQERTNFIIFNFFLQEGMNIKNIS
jgi:hypothetical protein